MLPEIPPTAPVPCKDQHEKPPLTQERALGDVVESPLAVGPRFHIDGVVELDAVPPSVDDDNDADQHRVDQYDEHHEYDDYYDRVTSYVEAARPSAQGGEPRDQRRDQRRDYDDERAAKRELLERDRFERRVSRERARRERLERRAHRSAQPRFRRGRSPARRSRELERRFERAGGRVVAVPGRNDPSPVTVRDRRERAVPGFHRGELLDHHGDVAADASPLIRPLGSRVHGAALVLYFVLLPYVVLTKWRETTGSDHATLVRALLVVLGVFWLGFLCQVVRNVTRLRRGGRVRAGGSAWLAGLVVALLALLAPTSHVALKESAPIAVPFHETHARSRTPLRANSLAGMGSLPLALMAKRRGDLLRQQPDETTDFDVDESIELLRARNPELVTHLAALIGDQIEGVIDVKENAPATAATTPVAPLVACVLRPSVTSTLISFAHEGGRLAVAPSWSSDDIIHNAVALHDGRIVFARSEAELLRALATRTLRQNVVIFLGAADQLDDELAACAVTVRTHVNDDGTSPSLPVVAPQSNDLRVELLRADPNVVGLLEPFAPTLRRRCVEMVAYLALHRHEPVTGERLRTRVLAHADVDASQRTLANTASAVRRSLGTDAEGPRLHPVSSSGLYVTHGLSSDVETFFSLVARARHLPVGDAAPLAHQALLLIKGEPLSSALRGFEWFLAEGHGARLARDGEWAALALHHTALEKGNYELAFWAIQQGRLIDPYSDALSEALMRVPRLREFGGDRASRTQDEPVGARGAVAMSWSFTRFSQQVSK